MRGRVCGLEGCLLGKACAWSCSGQITSIEAKARAPQTRKDNIGRKKLNFACQWSIMDPSGKNNRA